MATKRELIEQVRGMLRPRTMSVLLINGVYSFNGLTLSQAQIDTYAKKNTVRIFKIVPASKKFLHIKE